MDTLKPGAIEPAELDRVAEFAGELGDNSTFAGMLRAALETVREGDEFCFGPANRDLTTTQAAHVLGVSRPHLYKLLDEGAVPFHTVGAHRRISLSDMLVFLGQRDEARAGLAESFANVDEHRRRLARRLAGVDDETARRVGG